MNVGEKPTLRDAIEGSTPKPPPAPRYKGFELSFCCIIYQKSDNQHPYKISSIAMIGSRPMTPRCRPIELFVKTGNW